MLVAGAAFCAQTIDFSRYGRLGLYAPNSIHKYIHNPQPGDLAYLSRFVLDEHYASIVLNEKTNGDKIEVLTRAKKWWVRGTSAALGTLAGNSMLIERACCWLAG